MRSRPRCGRASRPWSGQAGPAGVACTSLRGDQVSAEDRTLLQAAARAVLLSRRGTLADQVIRLERPVPRVREAPPEAPEARSEAPAPRPELEFDNGLGGFADDGRTYVTILGPGQSTPAPWVNIVANSSFGFQVSESGSGYTWSGNSRENQLTPWSNDPVSDPVSEAIYIRDDETGELWGPTALPIRCEGSTYTARHAPGHSRFEHEHDGIALDLVQLVALDDPLKISVLTIENRSRRPRRLSVTAYAEWALGTSRGADAHRIVTALDPETQAILVRNPWNTRVRRPRCLPRPWGTADGVDGRPDGVPRPQRRSRAARGTAPWSPAEPGRRCRHGSVRRPQGRVRAWARREDHGYRAPRPGRRGRGRDRPDREGPNHRPRGDAAPDRRLLGERAGRGPGADAGPLDGHPAQRLAHLPDAGLPPMGPDSLLPGGRRLRLPGPAAGRPGPARREARAGAGAPAAGRGARSSSRGTSSTGGTRRRAAACGRGSRTIASGCRTWLRVTSR